MAKEFSFTTDECHVSISGPDSDNPFDPAELQVTVGQTSLDARRFFKSEGGSGKIWHVALFDEPADAAVPCCDTLAYAHMPNLLDLLVESTSSDGANVALDDVVGAVAYGHVLACHVHDNIML